MPFPFIIIGIAAAGSAVFGVGKSIKAVCDVSDAKDHNKRANELVDIANSRINKARKDCGASLEALGKKKLHVLNHSMREFIGTYENFQDIDFRQSVGLNELSKFQLDSRSLSELKEMTGMATSILTGVGSGALGGAITAFGAYSLAGLVGTASTGTAIAGLSGAVASNATLAFLGGGSLAAGGFGMAGGTMILGGLVAGPALAIMGLVVGAKASKAKDEALSNLAKARKYYQEMEAAADLCRAIKQRSDMFNRLLTKLEKYFESGIRKMKSAVEEHGYDLNSFSEQQQKIVWATASLAQTIKAVLDTPILTSSGNLTDESGTVLQTNLPFMNSTGIRVGDETL